MEHENVDEAIAFQSACKKVRQIANTIKAIRIKYYPNFAKISDTDREAYDRLYAQIDRFAEENGLTKLKTELIEDIEDRFDNDTPQEKDGQDKKITPVEKTLKAYYGAIDAGQQALSEGKLKKALSCQKQADLYMSQLTEYGQADVIEMATHYKREKFSTLSLEREKNSVTNWNDFLKNSYKSEDLQARNDLAQEILQISKKNDRGVEKTEETKENNLTQDMLLET